MACVIIGFAAGDARAGSHTWDVNEVFGHADRTIQFVELFEAMGTAFEIGVPGHTMSSDTQSFVISGDPLVSPTSNKFYLMATQSFALPGRHGPSIARQIEDGVRRTLTNPQARSESHSTAA